MMIFKRVMLTTTLAIVLMLPFEGSAISGTLNGTVVDNFYFNPVQGVEVTAYEPDSTLAGVDTTDLNGAYSISLDAGDYYAAFSKTNYADTTIGDITITPEGTTTVDLTFRFVHNCVYVVGDINGSSNLNGLDVTYGINYFERGISPPMNCLCECTPGHFWYVCGDVNGSCFFNGLDITYMLTIQQGGPYAIPCPDCPPVE